MDYLCMYVTCVLHMILELPSAEIFPKGHDKRSWCHAQEAWAQERALEEGGYAEEEQDTSTQKDCAG